jgi:hypothetical protein
MSRAMKKPKPKKRRKSKPKNSKARSRHEGGTQALCCNSYPTSCTARPFLRLTCKAALSTHSVNLSPPCQLLSSYASSKRAGAFLAANSWPNAGWTCACWRSLRHYAKHPTPTNRNLARSNCS